MFNTNVRTVKARRQHRCTSCGELILIGDAYKRWVTLEDSAFTSKMHPECYKAHEKDSLRDGGGAWEYSPYGHFRGSADDLE